MVAWYIASYPGHVGEGKSGLVSTIRACAKTPMILLGVVYHCLRTVNLYRILRYCSEACPSRTYLANIAGKGEDFDKALKFAPCCIEKGDFMLKAKQLDAIKCIYDGTYSCGYPRDLVSLSATTLGHLFSTTSTVTMEPVVVVALSLSCHHLCL